MYKIIDKTPPDDSTRQTTKDKQYNSTLYLREFSARLNDVRDDLSRLIELFSERSTLNGKQNSALVSIRKTIISYLSNSTVSIHKSVTLLSFSNFWLVLCS